MTEKIFTLDELKNYDGKEGRKAYIAVDGVVYDVTNVAAWQGGTHHGNNAGNDVSDRIVKAPHGKSILEKLEVVGKLG
ncbi:cytochrome B5 [Lactobacillus salivarius]|uniref:Cytochrome B5 n=1 Tax=Ligilactobacillus salivarius TaxID=1624 RepID=A0A5C8H6I9_9LACO|nr:cytochrome b5 domain-containing protein [Ligilactobacillus salivarius]HBU67175.1 cytochrome B5 [Lactobacillus sp.]MBM6708576.1 cytochrome B5 [Ligilactobacillus salivarius]MBX0284147.1 cytochrome B5 [Ligilactobacillus salivarius]MDE1498978.1 cytochrome b5 domain-containing protein [Ligilactobacillus salivarius]MDE1500987.1 cytochrome b5 domain-containing protein [Ligilactobacillus salivarius]